jgi:uncharacterized protein
MSPSTPQPTARLMACPQCRCRVVYDLRNPHRPFCSERCRQMDLGAWANEQFRVAAEPPQDANDPPSR